MNITDKFNFELMIENFKNDKQNGIKQSLIKEKESNIVLDSTIRKWFPIDKIMEMTEEQYCTGHQNKNSFCNIIERRCDAYGSIRGATKTKFGVFGNKDGTFGCNKSLDPNNNHQLAFQKIKQAILNLLKTCAKGNDEELENEWNTNILSPMFKSKLLSIYFPEKFIHIHDERCLEKYLNNLNITFNENTSYLQKKKLLFNLKEINIQTSHWSNVIFTEFLWKKYWYESAIKYNKEKDKLPKSVNIICESINPPKSIDRNSNFTPNYVDAAINKKNIGDYGEYAVLEWERNRLKSLGQTKYKKIKLISSIKPHAGYDIDSFNLDGTPLHIEVKTASCILKNQIKFYITANEYERLLNDPSFIIYYVSGVKTNFEITILDKNFFKSNKPHPVLFYYDIKCSRLN